MAYHSTKLKARFSIYISNYFCFVNFIITFADSTNSKHYLILKEFLGFSTLN